MAKDPAFLFYPGDWQGGTSTFSRHLKGCYIDLLIAQFNIGPLTLEEIKTVLAADYGQVWATLQKKFKTSNGLFFNERLETEKKKRSEYSQSQRDKRLGKTKIITHDKSHEKPVINHMENENKDEVKISKGGMGETQKFKNITTSTIWLESIGVQKKLTRQQTEAHLQEFLSDLWLKEDFDKPEREIKKHFISWLNIQLKTLKKEPQAFTPPKPNQPLPKK